MKNCLGQELGEGFPAELTRALEALMEKYLDPHSPIVERVTILFESINVLLYHAGTMEFMLLDTINPQNWDLKLPNIETLKAVVEITLHAMARGRIHGAMHTDALNDQTLRKCGYFSPYSPTNPIDPPEDDLQLVLNLIPKAALESDEETPSQT